MILPGTNPRDLSFDDRMAVITTAFISFIMAAIGCDEKRAQDLMAHMCASAQVALAEKARVN